MEPIKIKVSGKWSKRYDGWIVNSTSPEISSSNKAVYYDFEEAFEDYHEKLVTWAKMLIQSGSPEISVSKPAFSGKNTDMSMENSKFIITLPRNEVKISWSIRIRNQENRSLDDFIQPPEVLLDFTDKPDSQKIVDIIRRINQIAEEGGISPKDVFNNAIAELNRQKIEAGVIT